MIRFSLPVKQPTELVTPEEVLVGGFQRFRAKPTHTLAA